MQFITHHDPVRPTTGATIFGGIGEIAKNLLSVYANYKNEEQQKKEFELRKQESEQRQADQKAEREQRALQIALNLRALREKEAEAGDEPQYGETGTMDVQVRDMSQLAAPTTPAPKPLDFGAGFHPTAPAAVPLTTDPNAPPPAMPPPVAPPTAGTPAPPAATPPPAAAPPPAPAVPPPTPKTTTQKWTTYGETPERQIQLPAISYQGQEVAPARTLTVKHKNDIEEEARRKTELDGIAKGTHIAVTKEFRAEVEKMAATNPRLTVLLPLVQRTAIPVSTYDDLVRVMTAKPPEKETKVIGRTMFEKQDDGTWKPIVTGAGEAGAKEKPEITGGQAATLTRNYINDFRKNNSNAARTSSFAKDMDIAMKSAEAAYRSGQSLNAQSQVIISLFNKITDPNSVVRESEYARSAAGLSLIQRMEGAVTRWLQGGAGMTEEGLRNIVDMAKELANRGAEEFTSNTFQLAEQMADIFEMRHGRAPDEKELDAMMRRALTPSEFSAYKVRQRVDTTKANPNNPGDLPPAAGGTGGAAPAAGNPAGLTRPPKG